MFGKVVCDKAACEGEMRKIVQLCVTKLCVCYRILFERNGLACSVGVTKCHACHGKTKVQYGPCRQMPRLPRDSEPRASTRASGDHPPSSSARSLCVLCLSHDSQPQASDDHARSSSARKLCVLRLPHDSQPRASATPGGSVYGAYHTTASRGPAATTRTAAPPGGSVYCVWPRAQQLLQEALCTALPHLLPTRARRACRISGSNSR